jgi:hypothetical protein
VRELFNLYTRRACGALTALRVQALINSGYSRVKPIHDHTLPCPPPLFALVLISPSTVLNSSRGGAAG